ncbi:conserved hypothetical protein [Trichinella spiralis]|uniref:hypothetical protein n=1 Tax=Trichinella spiralis TaxID=6334 RepID=UPI0001EFE35C|nr:conserved hypothetical protein [Trichinella spiralis]
METRISEKMLTVQVVVSLVWLIVCGSADLGGLVSNICCSRFTLTLVLKLYFRILVVHIELGLLEWRLPDGRCVCDSDFDGINCQLKVGTCIDSDCYNGGSCFQLSPNTYKCLCPYSYDGTFCETPYNFMELGMQLIKRNYLFQAFIIVVVITTIAGYVFMIRKAHRLIKREYVDRNVRKFVSQRIEGELVKRKEVKPVKIKSSSIASIFRRSSAVNNTLDVKRKSIFDGNVRALKKESLSAQPIKAYAASKRSGRGEGYQKNW